MVVGTPVLYLEGGLIDRLAGTRLPGACANPLEIKTKARRLIEGDRALAEGIRSNQARVVETFAPEVGRRQWGTALFCWAQSSWPFCGSRFGVRRSRFSPGLRYSEHR